MIMEQTIEHVTITEVENDMYRLEPDEGYMLYNKRTEKRYSEAVTDDLRMWEAVEVSD